MLLLESVPRYQLIPGKGCNTAFINPISLPVRWDNNTPLDISFKDAVFKGKPILVLFRRIANIDFRFCQLLSGLVVSECSYYKV